MLQPNLLTRRAALRMVITGLGAVTLAACSLPTTQPETATTQPPAPPTDTSAPPTETSGPTDTVPPVPSDTPTGAAGGQPPVLARQNLPGLSEVTLTIPAHPQRYIWLSPGVNLPGLPDPRPALLLQAEAELHPIQLDPLGLGQPIPLPLNGTQILAISPDGSSMVIKDPSRTALFHLDGPILRELPVSGEAYGASYSRDGRYLVVTSASQLEANVFDLTGDPSTAPVTLTGFSTAAPVYDVTIPPGGQIIAWHARATLMIQDVASGQMGAHVSYTDFIGNMVFSPDGSKLALDVAGNLYVYGLPGLQELASLPLSVGPNSLDWSPDGTLLAGGYQQGLEIWDAATLEPLLSLPGPNDFTGLAQFSPDGRYIATIHDNNVFGVWSSQ